jgi:NADH-quinone oxidoreductase subunit N
MTIGMLGLAGIPGTVGFIGKFQLIDALVSGSYTWLAIVLVLGSMISLGYYLRVVATIWMRAPVLAPTPSASAPGGLAPIAGGSIEADEWAEGPGAAGATRRYPEVVFVAVVFAAAVIFFGIFPSPLFHAAAHAANALPGLF